MNLYGRNSILERLKTDAKSIKNIFAQGGQEVAAIENICRQQGIPISYLSQKALLKKARGIRSQGLIAEADEFKYADFDDIVESSRPLGRGSPTEAETSFTDLHHPDLARGFLRRGLSLAKARPPVFLFLDNLNDPQNLGSIIRTSACLGNFAIMLPCHDSVEVTEAVLRVASGGENYVPVCKSVNLSLAIKKAKEAGYWIGGAVIKGGEDLHKTNLNFPLGLVIGSEGKGIRQGLVSHLDFKLTIPMRGAGLSFNVACATALFCYEVFRQREK